MRRLALELAVRHEVVLRNPIDRVSRLRSPPHVPDALTPAEANVIRCRDIDITGAPPSIHIAGTIVSHRSEPTARQDHPKTAQSRRTVAIPTFIAEAVRERLTQLRDPSLDALLFCSREGTPLITNNVRRQLRHVMGLAPITAELLDRALAKDE